MISKNGPVILEAPDCSLCRGKKKMINVARAGIILRQFLLNKITISQSVFYTSVAIVLCCVVWVSDLTWRPQSTLSTWFTSNQALLSILVKMLTKVVELAGSEKSWKVTTILSRRLQLQLLYKIYFCFHRQCTHQLKTPVGGLKSEMGTNRYFLTEQCVNKLCLATLDQVINVQEPTKLQWLWKQWLFHNWIQTNKNFYMLFFIQNYRMLVM